jgi:hypothetical protein
LDHGVKVIEINPSYTSTQGKILCSQQRGWTVNQAATGVIARRSQGFIEDEPAMVALHKKLLGAIA